MGSGHSHPDVADPYVRELRELGLDLIQMAFDLAGIFDPTPISDGASGLLALSRGQWLDAIISGASMIPYVGDLAKAGKLPRYLKVLERAAELAEKSSDAAKALLPGLEKLKQVLDMIPSGSNQTIDRMKLVVDRAVKSSTAAVKNLPDISRHFTFRQFEKNGKVYQEASGRLGIPGKVRTHRSKSAQTKVSGGTGDDAGHLIGDRFGAPGTSENLTQQNWKSNRQGTFRQLEDRWAKKLKQGTGIDVKVSDVTRKGEDRPFMRKVEWTEIAPDGTRTKNELTFANTHTPKSRDQQGIQPTVTSPQKDNVIGVDFVNKKKLD
ncbi:DNA/RNA non-specific endonuclease [Rhodopirellula sp. JC639]|uniref:DNA/RNA non-specific endonuclease n=1 Tax=Stieleria mannarensis TaxID=2755585 RepID=UPI001C7235ED|nr:DNA/RNA non-specific endonuclease [Rhodopirellula sp. JC639]